MALKEAMRNVPMIEKGPSAEPEAIRGVREALNLPEVDHEKWLKLPRKYTRMVSRFELPIDSSELLRKFPFLWGFSRISSVCRWIGGWNCVIWTENFRGSHDNKFQLSQTWKKMDLVNIFAPEHTTVPNKTNTQKPWNSGETLWFHCLHCIQLAKDATEKTWWTGLRIREKGSLNCTHQRRRGVGGTIFFQLTENGDGWVIRTRSRQLDSNLLSIE